MSYNWENLWFYVFHIIILVLSIWIFKVESEGNTCHNERRRVCESDKYAVDPQPGDTEADLLQRLENHARLHEEKVIWRRSILYALIGCYVFWIIIARRLPTPFETLYTTAFLYILFYVMNAYFILHFDVRASNKAIGTINQLRSNLGLKILASNSDFHSDWFL